jgi:cysteine desulfuration protein SufE
MTIFEKQNIIESKLNSLENWDDKFSYIIEKGMMIKNYPSSHKTDEYLIRECQSKLWIFCSFIDNKMIFDAHSETVIVRGIVAVLFEVYSEASPFEIINTPITIFDKSGMSKVLSSRVTGITGIINKIKFYASQYNKVV